MMRKIKQILFLMMLSSLLAAQPVNTFNKIYSVIPGYGTGSSAISIATKGYILYGGTLYQPNQECMGILKIDTTGKMIWAKYYPNSNYFFTSLASSSEMGMTVPWGGEIATGILQNDTTGFFDWGLYRFDGKGDTVWTKNYKDSTDFWVNQIKITRDKGYLLYGEWINNRGYPLKVAIIKTDSSGNVRWHKTYGGNNTCFEAFGIDTCSDKGYILCASQYDSLYYCTHQTVVIKTDSLGNVKWKKTIHPGSPCEDQPMGIISLKDDGYAISGFYDDSNSHNLSQEDYSVLYLLRLSSKGDTVWSRRFTKPTVPWVAFKSLWSLRELSNGDMVSCGFVTHDSGGIIVGNILKVDSNGNEKWLREYLYGNIFISNQYYLTDIQLTKEGGFVSSGTVILGDTSFIWVIKTDSLGCDTSDCNYGTGIAKAHGESEGLKVYPNPSNGVFILQATDQRLTANSYIEIYNMLGEKIYDAILKQVQGDNLINLSNQPNGVYLYRAVKEDGTLVGEGKLLLQN